MTRTFVLATDGTETSRSSEDYITEMLDPDKDKIHILYVIKLLAEEEISEIFLSVDVDELKQLAEERAEEILESRAKRLRKKGFEVETEFLYGKPGPEICRRAEELDAEGIFLGRGKHGQFGEMFYGSVSHFVILNSKSPVIVTSPAHSSESD